MFFIVEVTNRDTIDLIFPWKYHQGMGPDILLVDRRTKEEHVQDWELPGPDIYPGTLMKPGQTVTISWAIYPATVEAFRNPYLDLDAEISIHALVKRNGVEVEIEPATKLHVVGTVRKRRSPRGPGRR